MSVEQDKSVKMPSYDSPKRILPGRRLRAAREITHMTIAEIANHLRLDPRLITALEEDKHKHPRVVRHIYLLRVQ